MSLFNQSAHLINRWPHLSEPVIFTAPKLFQACSQLNEWSLSKPNRPRHPAGSPHAASQTYTHIYICKEQQWLIHTSKHTSKHNHKHIRHATLPGDLWLEPAALTQQYINHWALSSSAGPQCHAELDSTGIKVRNWIQKLIQARDNCWHTEALEVLIPPCDDMPSMSWDLWLLH